MRGDSSQGARRAPRGMGTAMRRFVVVLVLAASFGVGVADALAADPPPEQPARTEATHEILSERPSGFWTSNTPAQNGAYRYRLLGIGIVLGTITAFLMVRMIKRANAHRRAHPTPAILPGDVDDLDDPR